MDSSTIVLGSGTEGRIVAEYLARRKRLRTTESGGSADAINEIWLDLARKYKRPVRELKDIVNRYQTEQNPNRTLEPPKRFRSPRCRCGETENVRWISNPYNVEIYGDFTKQWLCPSCEHEIAMDI